MSPSELSVPEARSGQSSSDHPFRPVRLAITGVPGSGKTTTAQAIAEHYGAVYLHSSQIVRQVCPGDWIEKGELAPEPCATLAIERMLDGTDEWVLDGYPRSERQIRSIGYDPIVYLDISTRAAIARAVKRGRASPEIEEHRIRTQQRSLAPVKKMAAVIIPVTFRDPDEVIRAVIRWYDQNLHPSEFGSLAR